MSKILILTKKSIGTSNILLPTNFVNTSKLLKATKNYNWIPYTIKESLKFLVGYTCILKNHKKLLKHSIEYIVPFKFYKLCILD